MTRRILVPMLVLAVAATAAADGNAHLKPEAQKHLDGALAAYKDKNWPIAIREFEQAFAIDPDTNLLYALAQAYRFNNDCGKALDYYKRYLQSRQCSAAADRSVCEAQIAAANTGISLCASAQPPPPVQEPTPPSQPPPQSPALSPTPPPPSPPATTVVATTPSEPSWYVNGTADALTAGGVVAIGVGVGFLVKASSSESAAKSATLRNDFLRDLSDATSQRRVGAIVFGAGVALAAGGIYLYVSHDRKTTVVGTTDGHTIGIAGSF